jgi:arginyl-tRNA synthetase
MMDFDLELAVKQSSENPVYYAQYAHARLANVETFAAGRELPAEPDLSLLEQPWELDLARQIAYWPEEVEQAAQLLEPHRIPYYVQGLADAVHAFYQAGNRDWSHRVVVDDPGLTRARLEMSRAARNTLRTALDVMGVAAPDRM